MAEKIKCCHLTSVHPPFDTRIFHKQLKSLKKAGFDVTLVVPHTGDESVDDIRIKAVKVPNGRLERMFVTAFRVFWAALREKADIYHFHDPELIPAGLILKLFGKTVIYDVHEDYPKSIIARDYINRYLRKIISSLVSLAEKSSSFFFDGVIAATEDINNNIKGRNTVTIRNYPHLNSSIDLSANRPENENNTYIIYVGGISPERGITEAIKAIEHTDGVRLMLCGDYSPRAYEDVVRRLKGFTKTEYCGYVRYKDLDAYMLRAHIGIVCLLPTPRYIDSLPTKMFEYMAHGIPVIASDFPLWKEIVEGNQCGVCVDPTKPLAIAEAIKYLKDRPELRRAMGDNGRKAVQEKYCWERESDRLIGVYRGLIFTDVLL